MPKRQDLQKILLIGSGPIVIGQACEFDYSGTQACKALKEEGYSIVLVNSNPATIMTDPDLADRTYLEPLTPDVLEKIIRRERPQALLPTMGGQTALNLAVTLAETGVLERYGVELIGAKLEAIKKAEDRDLFKQVMQEIGLVVPRSVCITRADEAPQVLAELGLPLIIRPSFTLGGTGGNIAHTVQEFEEHVAWGLAASPRQQVLIEESVLGWKEYELEVMRDLADNVVIICSIENVDAMGVHTGDSITVAPAQTLSDKEYQHMRDAAVRIIRAIGVETGGSNIQFAVNPTNGAMVVIEMNPRVSRSSALASKATGFPIAKIAAKLAVGYTLDEIPNDITRVTPASFEPTIDYCVVKMPRFAFEKFPETDPTLTTQMKSVGEAMAIGRTFKEALQKAMRSLETGHYGFESPSWRDRRPRRSKPSCGQNSGHHTPIVCGTLQKLYAVAWQWRPSPSSPRLTPGFWCTSSKLWRTKASSSVAPRLRPRRPSRCRTRRWYVPSSMALPTRASRPSSPRAMAGSSRRRSASGLCASSSTSRRRFSGSTPVVPNLWHTPLTCIPPTRAPAKPRRRP